MIRQGWLGPTGVMVLYYNVSVTLGYIVACLKGLAREDIKRNGIILHCINYNVKAHKRNGIILHCIHYCRNF